MHFSDKEAFFQRLVGLFWIHYKKENWIQVRNILKNILSIHLTIKQFEIFYALISVLTKRFRQIITPECFEGFQKSYQVDLDDLLTNTNLDASDEEMRKRRNTFLELKFPLLRWIGTNVFRSKQSLIQQSPNRVRIDQSRIELDAYMYATTNNPYFEPKVSARVDLSQPIVLQKRLLANPNVKIAKEMLMMDPVNRPALLVLLEKRDPDLEEFCLEFSYFDRSPWLAEQRRRFKIV